MKRQDKQALEHYLQQLELVRSIDGANPFETNQEQENRINRAKKDVEYMVEYYFPHYGCELLSLIIFVIVRNVNFSKTIVKSMVLRNF